MKKRFSKILPLLSISSLAAVVIGLACAGGDWPEYGSSGFTPEAFADSSYSPFFLSDQAYYKIGYDVPADDRFKDANLQEWSAWLKGAAADSVVSKLLYQTSSKNIDSVLKALPLNAGTRNNSRFKNFISYLRKAKLSERYASYSIDNWWDYSEKKRTIDTQTASQMITAWKAALQTQKDIFLRQRIIFQLVRANYFAGNYAAALQVFEANKAQMPSDRMYFRSLAYAAGALYKQKQYAKANYYYSLVFAGSPEQRPSAHFSFHPQDEADWNSALALCKNNAEKATLWQMLGISYGDEMRSIKAINQLEAGSDKMDVLLLRWINKFEQSDDFFSDPNSYRQRAYDTAGRQQIAVIRQIADNSQPKNAPLWQMGAGYLSMLTGNYKDADQRFSKAAKIGSTNSLFTAQLRLLTLSRKLFASTTMTKALEQECLPDLQWLMNIDNPEQNEPTGADFRYSDLRGKIRQEISARYRKQGELIKAECFVHSSDYFADSLRTDQFLQFLQKPGKTPYEQFCVSINRFSAEELYEYKAIVSALKTNLPQAIAFMEKAGKAQAFELPGNPFNARINDCHDCDHAAAQKVKYSNLQLLKKLQDMQMAIAQNKDVYNNARLLGNAYYNLTHFGNARAFYESAVMGEGFSQPEYIDSVFRPMLTNMLPAIKYYQIAFGAATNNEQRAQMQYLLAKCQRNQWFMAKSENDTRDFINWDGFNQLRQYTDTKYYQEVLKECGWFRP